MDRSVAGASEGGRRSRGRRRLPSTARTGPSAVARLGAVALALAASAATASGLGAQETPAATDTARTESLFAAPPDTVPADTLSPRERALQRLRSFRADPVEVIEPVDSATSADSAAVRDSVSADTTVLGPGEGEGQPAPRADTTAEGLRQPPMVVDDTLVVFADEGPDRPIAEDSVLAWLRRLEGYEATEYVGEAAQFDVKGDRLRLTGGSKIRRAGSGLETDSLLIYSGRTGIVCGYGKPVLTGEGDPIESDQVCFDIDQELGVARGARTQFQQQATWYVRGANNRVYLLTGGERTTLYGEGTEFTSCELDHPHYTFRAKSVKMVEEGTMVARDITLRFDDVPVFWLPWMVQSMKRGRRSGLLMPEFGVNDIVRNSTGYNRHLSNIGFYWAINDYMSAKGTFEWYSNNWTAVEGALTYRWLRQFLQGSLTAKSYWRQLEGGPQTREFTLNTANSWQPDERTRIQLNANFATSTDFVRENSFDPRELNRQIRSSASVNRSFSWGSMSLGADRSEQLSTGQVDMELPGLSVNISPITIIPGEQGGGLSWSGSGTVNRRTRSGGVATGRDRETVTAGYNHRFNLGGIGFGQRIDWSDEWLGPQPADTAANRDAIAEASTQRFGWSTTLSYQQVLWPGTTLSPSLSMRGNQLRNDSTAGTFVAEPTRISTGASLNTAIYGFWPGFGNFSRIRHKIAPTLRWSYSPAPEITELQQRVFGTNPSTLREQNEISLSFNQTFEAKVRDPDPDSTAADSAAVAGDRSGEPRRLPQAEKVLLLALDTRTSFVYDFVAAREDGRGFQTDRITNSVRSDLLRGLQLSTTHSLFEEGETTEGGGPAPRTFSPYLTSLTASFSIDNEFWLFGLLGLTGGDDPAGPGQGSRGPPEDAEGVAGSQDAAVGAESDPDRTPGGVGSMVPNRGPVGGGMRGGRGWQASLNYSLQRARPGLGGASDSQLLSGNLSFQPTELWSVRWSTAYSFTDNAFANHVLTLTRDLHRWQANFDFIKAQNGNFAMQFRVQLRDNPELKVDYDQRSGPSERSRPGDVRFQ